MAVGVWGKVNLEFDLLLSSDKGTNAPYVLIGTGAIIIIFGLFGCFATCRGSPWMLKLVRSKLNKTSFLTVRKVFGAHFMNRVHFDGLSDKWLLYDLKLTYQEKCT